MLRSDMNRIRASNSPESDDAGDDKMLFDFIRNSFGGERSTSFQHSLLDSNESNEADVIFPVPSFPYKLYRKALKCVLQAGVILDAMPGERGFDLVARNRLGDDFVNAPSLFALETLPRACRLLEYGKSVAVLGSKVTIDVCQYPQGWCQCRLCLEGPTRLGGRCADYGARKQLPSCHYHEH